MQLTETDLLNVVVVGHVDHGKSTLLGRWLIDAGNVADDRISKVESICAEKGLPFEPAFLLDAFEEEQSQGVSIDSTRAQLVLDGRKYLFIDCPGHIEFLKNMTSGASAGDLGILVIDAIEGIRAQTATHLNVLAILGLREAIVCINKMDKVGYDQVVFDTTSGAARQLMAEIGINSVALIPISALTGENVIRKSENLNWYSGPTLFEAISSSDFQQRDSGEALQFRMILQDVYKVNDERYFAGRVIAGEINVGDRIYFSPAAKATKIASIARYPNMNCQSARAGDSIAITLAEQLYVERGEVISRPEQAPEVDKTLRVRIVWISHEPLDKNSEYLLKLGTAEIKCTISYEDRGVPIVNGDIVDLIMTLDRSVAFDRTGLTGGLNQLVICSAYETVAAGVVDAENLAHISLPQKPANVEREKGYIERAEREQMYGHKGVVLWLTGLSGAGKSTLAKALERRLFESKLRVLVLDADSVRTGLCADLGFTPEDRSENNRRIAEVARLCASMGCIVVVACLSPYRKDREMARTIIGADDFEEVFVQCPLEVCLTRDPKGLYRKFREGSVVSFSGMDSPYQVPLRAALTLDSSKLSLQQEVEAILELLKQRSII